MLLWVLPEFAAIYRSSDTPLPAFTRQLINLSDFLLSVAPAVLVLTVILTAFWRTARKHFPDWIVTEQRLLLKVPLAGCLWQAAVLARIFSLLALTQRAGLPLREGLTITQNLHGRGLWQQALCALQQHIEQGQPLSSGLRLRNEFPQLCYLLTRLGEQTGASDILFVRLADWFENIVRQKAGSLAASVEPVMLIITAIITGSIVIAMYLPMFSLGDALF
ncbi:MULTISPECIES: type II secretion system F family protein [unclassified Tatumella]|uniref:type II secretion system F family protein n=1 Tax=unclassified Tatumella TaxID=2649542 RepID=UPI001BAED395|nr:MULTISPECIES: type II secretion system F family protein [unclassified Tatumella]MBS0877445.1 type II secretion system F family protein [Tatumella sp. JGM82]MBS0891013.1 type II secretion system F family protein [Tatumella sp. JGM94]MBS0902027.1 type II secretion system F family protein [Tatumella sp. JGM100]